MSFSNESVGSGTDGAIHNFFGELPAWMEHSDVNTALLELDANVRGIQEPPIARVMPSAGEGAAIEDYRFFYVELEPQATTEDIVAAVHIVAEALKKYRYAD